MFHVIIIISSVTIEPRVPGVKQSQRFIENWSKKKTKEILQLADQK
jgi:hypothetical protein